MSLDVINGCAALITGASSGIGREMAKQLAGDGVNLILAARSEESLRSLADEIRDPAEVSVIPKDLSHANSPQELFDELKDRKLQVDILINNAGFGALGKSWLFQLGTMTASGVAAAGLDGLRRNRVVVVPGLKNKLSAWAVRFVPRSLVRKLVKNLQHV